MAQGDPNPYLPGTAIPETLEEQHARLLAENAAMRQGQSGASYSDAQLAALDGAVRGPLAPFAGGALTIEQMISGRYGQRAGEVGALFLENVEAEAATYSFDDTVENFAQRCHDAHRPLDDGDHSQTFSSQQRGRDFEIAENADAAMNRSADDWDSEQHQMAVKETMRATMARERNRGLPDGQDLSPDEWDEHLEAMHQHQALGRGMPTADFPVDDDDGPGLGFALDADGLPVDRVQMADDAAVAKTFNRSYDAAGRTLTATEIEQQESALGMNTRALNAAEVARCVSNIRGTMEG